MSEQNMTSSDSLPRIRLSFGNRHGGNELKKLTVWSFALVLTLFTNQIPLAHAAAPVSSDPPSAAIQTATHPNSYHMIRTALETNERFGQFDPTEVSVSEVGALIRTVVQENPSILYYKSAKVWSSGQIEFFYYVPTETMKKNRLALEKKVDELLHTIIKPHFTEFEKVKAIHDYLVLHTAYDLVNQQNNTIPADSYTAYGALVKGVAVCDGYTKAAQLLLDRLGIENHYVVGTIQEGLHSWNIVKLNGQYYFMDVTWDDPAPNKEGHIRYNYFLVTSEQLKKDHTWDMKKYPTATSKQYSSLHHVVNPVEIGNVIFFSHPGDRHKLYQMTTEGKQVRKVNDVRAPQFVISGDWIYFSNFSNRGFLYKMKKDGSRLQQINRIYSVDLQLLKDQLIFTDKQTKKVHILSLP